MHKGDRVCPAGERGKSGNGAGMLRWDGDGAKGPRFGTTRTITGDPESAGQDAVEVEIQCTPRRSSPDSSSEQQAARPCLFSRYEPVEIDAGGHRVGTIVPTIPHNAVVACGT